MMNNKDNYANKANQIWKMLDEMAESNPQSYRQFLEKQMKEAKVFFSKPAEFLAVKSSLKSTRNIPVFINICSWERVPVQEKADDPMPVTGGALFDCKLNGEQTSSRIAVVALNPTSLKSLESDKNNKNFTNNDLLQLILDVVESQNDQVILERSNIQILEKTFYGDFADLLEKTFPGISTQSQNALGFSPDASNLQSPLNMLQAAATLDDMPTDTFTPVLSTALASEKINKNRTPFIEELPDSEGKSADSAEVSITYDEKSCGPDRIGILVNISEHWILQDCFVKKPSLLTVNLVSNDQSEMTKRLQLQLTCLVEEEGAIAKYNKKINLLKVNACRSK